MWLKPFLSTLERGLFLTQCVLCQSKVTVGKNLCLLCAEALPWNHIACKQCAAPLELSHGEGAVCGECLQGPPLFFDQTYAAFIYQAPVVQMIGQLKFNQNLLFGAVLGQLLLRFLQTKYPEGSHWPEAIIPVPLHAKRFSERGYNQAVELTHPLEKALNIPMNLNLCRRIKPTLAQTIATARERRINLKNAFIVENTHNLKHVAIVDDVLTTGSTATALAKVLKKSGVERIDLWMVAKTHLTLVK
jgi:ComF family protein